MSRAGIIDVVGTWLICAAVMVKICRNAWREEKAERSGFPQ